MPSKQQKFRKWFNIAKILFLDERNYWAGKYITVKSVTSVEVDREERWPLAHACQPD
jgi:hypothetical protein